MIRIKHAAIAGLVMIAAAQPVLASTSATLGRSSAPALDASHEGGNNGALLAGLGLAVVVAVIVATDHGDGPDSP